MGEEKFYWRWISYPQKLIEQEQNIRSEQWRGLIEPVYTSLVRGGTVYGLWKRRKFWFDKHIECYVAFNPTKCGVLMILGGYRDNSGMKPIVLDNSSERSVLPQLPPAGSGQTESTNNCAVDTLEQRLRRQNEEHKKQLRDYREQRVTKLAQLRLCRELAIQRLNWDNINPHTLLNASAEQVPERHQRLFLKQVYECISQYLIDPERQLGELG